MTKRTLEKLNGAQKQRLTTYKNEYSKNRETKVRWGCVGYLEGLRDAGVITEQEKRTLFCWVTL